MRKRTYFMATVLLLFLGNPNAGRCGLNLHATEHILSNGLKILAVERPNVPVVSFALYYRVGSIDEQRGKTGIAHYCEHMMFKSTKNLTSESFARLIGAVGGGHSNANTSSDRTCYHETVPANRLELVIRLEAERMANLKPTREEARKELDVVLEELRLNYIDDPQGRFRFQLYDHAFDVHPYKTITIGRLEDVQSITYEDLMAFQRKYYVPNRAVAVVVGDFKTEELMRLMEMFFGGIPSGEAFQRNYPEEPPQARERRFELNLPVQREMLSMGYKAPPASNPDNLVLRVLCTILSHGGSSPFGKLAQGKTPVAMNVYAWCRASLDPDLLVVSGWPLPGTPLETLQERIDEIIDGIRENGVSSEVLERAKTQMLAEKIYAMQSSMGIAFSLGEAEMVGSWRDAVNLEERLSEIGVEDVLRVARKYLVPEHRTVGYLRNKSADDETKTSERND